MIGLTILIAVVTESMIATHTQYTNVNIIEYL